MSTSHIKHRMYCETCGNRFPYGKRTLEAEARSKHLCGVCRRKELAAAIDLELPKEASA